MTKKVDFHCVIIVDGRQWPITLSGQVETEDIGMHLTDACRWLIENGIRPAGTHLDVPGNQQNAPADEPICPVHNTKMRLSKFTRKGYKVTWYCPAQEGSGYCKHTASIGRLGVIEYTADK